VAGAQNPNRSYNIQPEANQSDQELSMGLQLRQRHQQSGEAIQYATKHATVLMTGGVIPSMEQTQAVPMLPSVAENLFHNIKIYFENSCRNMILDDHGTLLAPNGAELRNNLCNDFDSYCFTATMLIKKGLHVKFRYALFKASALIKQIL
jgi:hypothetical protein